MVLNLLFLFAPALQEAEDKRNRQFCGCRRKEGAEAAEISGIGDFAHWRILDRNGAAYISAALSTVSCYERAYNPEYDRMKLPFTDDGFDPIGHSDCLKHVENPVRALH